MVGIIHCGAASVTLIGHNHAAGRITAINQDDEWFRSYTYDETTGAFSTVPGVITVPAATYTQDPVTGAYTATPGTATLVVTGTI